MSQETQDTLLLGQCQDRLRYDLMKAPAVSGARSYKELCMAAKNKEKRLVELRKRQQYQKTVSPSLRPVKNYTDHTTSNKPPQDTRPGVRKCYLCNRPGHIAWYCRLKKSESRGCMVEDHRPSNTKQITSQSNTRTSGNDNLIDFLFSSSDEEDPAIRQIKVKDEGSKTHCARVQVQGVPMYGIIDSGADIMIIGGSLFRKLANIVRLRKRDLKKPDKVPRTYDQKPFILDGRMDLEVSFADKMMTTSVYIKMDAHDQLLLSEGVGRQLGIVSYHPDVEVWRGHRKQEVRSEAKVPSVRVRLIETVRLLPQQSTIVQVTVDGSTDKIKRNEMFLLKQDEAVEEITGLRVGDVLLHLNGEGRAHLVVSNQSGLTQVTPPGAVLGEATAANLVPAFTMQDELKSLRKGKWR